MDHITVDTPEIAQFLILIKDWFVVVLFSRVDPVVKGLLLILLLCLLYTWVIIIRKSFYLLFLKRQSKVFERQFWSGESLDQLYDHVAAHPKHPMEAIFITGMHEWRYTLNQNLSLHSTKLLQRIQTSMEITIHHQIIKVRKHLTLLGAIGTLSPFIGLLGTLWEIMSDFEKMSQIHTLTFSIVSTSLTEALFSTSIGLFVAIQAILAYKLFNTSLSHYTQNLFSFSQEFCNILSRYLEKNVPYNDYSTKSEVNP